jgi:hypothetical protein
MHMTILTNRFRPAPRPRPAPARRPADVIRERQRRWLLWLDTLPEEERGRVLSEARTAELRSK